MRLTRFTDNSLRVLIYLALSEERDITISEIAQKIAIPKNHLVKVVHSLAKRNFIKTLRGRNGGIRLNKTAKEIIVGDVVRMMEGQLEVIKCFEPRCPLATSCRLRNLLSEATDAFLLVLDKYSIYDLVELREDQLKKLLNIA